jgi:hypothetical protein
MLNGLRRTAFLNLEVRPMTMTETISEQVDALKDKAADVKSSFEKARKESQDKVRARFDQVKADVAEHEKAAEKGVAQASKHRQNVWTGLKADAVARHQDLHNRIDRKRDEREVNKAEKDAEYAEADAEDALDYADWAVDQAYLAVMDAAEARAWADARAAAQK